MTETQAITQAVRANPAGRVNRQETQTHPIVGANPTDPVVLGLDGSTKTIPNDAVAALRSKLQGSVALPGEDGYDAARTIWNAMVDRRPGLVVRCLGADDVINSVRLARNERLLVAVRAGGHNIAGNAVCDGGLLIDLSLMKSVRVDPTSLTARVEPGATLADFDREAQTFGLATPLWHQFHDRSGRPDAGRRLWLDYSQIWVDYR